LFAGFDKKRLIRNGNCFAFNAKFRSDIAVKLLGVRRGWLDWA